MLYVFPSDNHSQTVRCRPSHVVYVCIVLIILRMAQGRHLSVLTDKKRKKEKEK